MDSLDRFVAEARLLAEAEAILQWTALKVAEERMAADPEFRQAAIEHFRREALRHDPEGLA